MNDAELVAEVLRRMVISNGVYFEDSGRRLRVDEVVDISLDERDALVRLGVHWGAA